MRLSVVKKPVDMLSDTPLLCFTSVVGMFEAHQEMFQDSCDPDLTGTARPPDDQVLAELLTFAYFSVWLTPSGSPRLRQVFAAAVGASRRYS